MSLEEGAELTLWPLPNAPLSGASLCNEMVTGCFRTVTGLTHLRYIGVI